jgi:hypothetical protein
MTQTERIDAGSVGPHIPPGRPLGVARHCDVATARRVNLSCAAGSQPVVSLAAALCPR